MVRAELLRAAGVVTVAVRLDGVIDGRAPAPADLRYRLVAQPGGQGELDITFRTNIEGTDPAKPGIERVADHSRWLADGSGVATVRVTEGDLGDAAELLAVQCWDGRAAETHVAYLPQAGGGEGRPAIDAARCAFDDWAEPVFPPMSDERRELVADSIG